MANDKAGWTDNEEIDYSNGKAPPPPPEPGLYRFEVASAAPKTIGQDKKPGMELILLLKEPFGGGPSVDRKVRHYPTFDKERSFVILQLAESCSVSPPKRRGTEAVQEFCAALLDSKGGIVRIRQAKDKQSGDMRAEVAFDQPYLTEAEAGAVEAGGDSTAPAVARRPGKNAKPATAQA